MHPLLMLPAIVLGLAEPIIAVVPDLPPPAMAAPANHGELHWVVPAAAAADSGIAKDR